MAGTASLPTIREVIGPGGWVASALGNFEHREEQIKLAEGAFWKAILNGHHAITEAGTGVGKSFSYLVPAGIDAIQNNRQYVISTADKNLQRQLVTKDIPFLQELFKAHGIELRAVLLKGKGNYLCRYKIDGERDTAQLVSAVEKDDDVATTMLESVFGDDDEVAINKTMYPHAEALERLNAWEEETEDGDIDELPFAIPPALREKVTIDSDSCLGRKCPFVEECFVERKKSSARKAHLIVVNHALMLRDLAIRDATEGYAHVIPVRLTGDTYRDRDGETQVIDSERAARLVLDEAHHLRDIATDAFADEFTKFTYRRLRSRFENVFKKHNTGNAVQKIMLAVDAVMEGADDYFLSLDSRLPKYGALKLGDELEEAQLLNDTLTRLVSLLDSDVPSVLVSGDEHEAYRKAVVYTKRLQARTLALVSPEDSQQANAVRYAERGRRAIQIVRKPIDVSQILDRMLWSKFGTVLCTSATLATDNGFDIWKQDVGATDLDAVDLIVGTPFDFQKNSLLFVPQQADAFDASKFYNNKGTQEYNERMALMIWELVDAANGGAFVLFTSRRMMDAVYALIGDKMSARWLTMIQTPTMSRPSMIARFKEDGNAVIFGLKSFWEGVDVQGDALRLVIIDKLPFAPPDDPVFDARKERLTRKTGNEWAWFNQMAIPNAIIALKQGVGRLLRTKKDRGVVAILDGRMVTKPYGARILRALPPMKRTRGIEQVRAFFSKGN